MHQEGLACTETPLGFLNLRADPAPTLPHKLLFLSSRCPRPHGVSCCGFTPEPVALGGEQSDFLLWLLSRYLFL